MKAYRIEILLDDDDIFGHFLHGIFDKFHTLMTNSKVRYVGIKIVDAEKLE